MTLANNCEKLAPLFQDGSRLQYLMQECEFGTALKYLTYDQWQELWDLFDSWLKKNLIKDGAINTLVFEGSLALISAAIESDNITEYAGCVSKLVRPLKYILENRTLLPAAKSQDTFCKICEKWLLRKHPDVPDMINYTFSFMLGTVLTDSSRVQDVKRLMNFKQFLDTKIILDHISLLKKIILNQKFVGMKLGQSFLALVASLSIRTFDHFYGFINLELDSCIKKTATNFGKILMLAWHNAAADLKPHIASKFQDLMSEFIKSKRTALDLPKKSAIILSVINVWNEEVRNKTDQEFITMITKCYQPIIWKCFSCGPSYQRCNAADLFFKAFPMQLAEDPDADSKMFLDQVKYMEDLLRDDCPITRIIAIREICNILPAYWSLFSNSQINNLMKIIAKEEVCDKSSPEVRRMVWRGFESLLKTESACSYLKQMLPNLKDYLYDMHASVRIAFIQLLISIRDLKDPDFKFRNIASVSELTNCLQNEERLVCQRLIELLLPTYYKPSFSGNTLVLRVSALIKKHPHCYRNFFFYSAKSLEYHDAVKIMCTLIEFIGSFVMRKLKAENDENNSVIANESPNRRKPSKSSETTAMEQSSINSNCAFDDPAVVIGLFEIIGILWTLHTVRLSKDPVTSADLINTFIGHANHFIVYFKDSSVFTSVITLTSNVPVSVLTANSITLPGYCLKMLRALDRNELDDDHVLSMIVALVKWSRSADILELISLWLNNAFRPDRKSLESHIKRVKITEASAPDTIIAIRLLDKMLNMKHTRESTLKKSYDSLLEVFNTMEKIKDVIVERFIRETEFPDEGLCDEFLFACFQRYVRLIPHLHRDDEPLTEEDADKLFNAPQKFYQLLGWMQDELVPLLHSESQNNLTLITGLINQILNLTENMIIIGFIKYEDFDKIAEITYSLLSMTCNLYFLKAISSITFAIASSAYLQINIHSMKDIWSKTITKMIPMIFNAMVNRSHTQEEMDMFLKDFGVIRTKIGNVLKIYETRLINLYSKKAPARPNELPTIIQRLVTNTFYCLRAALIRNNVVNENKTISTYATIGSMPPIPATIIGSMYKNELYMNCLLVAIQQATDKKPKIVLIDLIIFFLIAHIEKPKLLPAAFSTLAALRKRLGDMIQQRGGDLNQSLGITLVAEKEKESSDDEFEEEVDTVAAPGPTRANSNTEASSAAALAARESEPASNVVTVGTEPRDSQGTELPGTGTWDGVPITMSQTAVSGSQPMETGASEGSTSQLIDDDDLFENDYIINSAELIKMIDEVIKKRKESAQHPRQRELIN